MLTLINFLNIFHLWHSIMDDEDIRNFNILFYDQIFASDDLWKTLPVSFNCKIKLIFTKLDNNT